MPEVVMRKELYTTFGSRSEYLAAPWWEVLEERARIIAEHEEAARKQAELDAQLAEQEREAGRYH